MHSHAKHQLASEGCKQKTAYEILSGLVGSEMCIRDRMSSPMELELELETVLSNPTPCDSSSAWVYRPQSISDVQAAAYAVELSLIHI